MRKKLETQLDKQSDVKSREQAQLSKPRQMFVTIFREELHIPEIALLSEVALAEHWLRPEEDAAWAHLQHLDPEKSS